jgi:hypothetical protein
MMVFEQLFQRLRFVVKDSAASFVFNTAATNELGCELNGSHHRRTLPKVDQ